MNNRTLVIHLVSSVGLNLGLLVLISLLSKWRSYEHEARLKIATLTIAVVAIVFLYPIIIKERATARVVAVGLCVIPIVASIEVIGDLIELFRVRLG
jgi:hypothetical protein